MFRRLAFGTIGLLVFAVCFSAIHYWKEVRSARASTVALVQQAFQTYGRHVTIKDIPAQRIEVLLKIEDPKFRHHRGVDLQTPGAGMTTITQGLVKLLYFPQGFQPGLAKVRQTLIAEYALNDLVSKDEQLELYLNATYFGSNENKSVHGIEAASQSYFQKSYRDLSNDEFIALIGMTISPNTLKPRTKASEERVSRIKAYLAGDVKPASVLDVEYVGKPGGTVAEEVLMSALRLIANASPGSVETHLQ